eukprot:gene18497-24995_t
MPQLNRRSAPRARARTSPSYCRTSAPPWHGGILRFSHGVRLFLKASWAAFSARSGNESQVIDAVQLLMSWNRELLLARPSPWKPHRVRMAHSLIVRYGLYKHLEWLCFVQQAIPSLAAPDELINRSTNKIQHAS